jgi:hypothetical protein
LQDIPFNKMLPTQNEDFKFQQGHIHFSEVNDTAEIITAGVNDPAEIN